MFNEATQAKIDQFIERLPQIGQAFIRQGLSLQFSATATPLDSPEPRLDVSLSLAAAIPAADPAPALLGDPGPSKDQSPAPRKKQEPPQPQEQEAPSTGPSFTDRMKIAASADEGRKIISEYEEAFADIEKRAGLPHSVGKGGGGNYARGYSTLTAKEKKAIVKSVSAESKFLGERLKSLIRDIDGAGPHWEALLEKERIARMGQEKPAANQPETGGARDLVEKEIAAKCARKGMTPEKIQGFKDFCARWFQVTGGFDALDEEHLDAIRTDLDVLLENYEDSIPLEDDAPDTAPAEAEAEAETLFDAQASRPAPTDGPIAARYGITIDDNDPRGTISTTVAQQLSKIMREHGIEYSALMRYLDLQHKTTKILDIRWGDVPAILYWMETNKPTAN